MDIQNIQIQIPAIAETENIADVVTPVPEDINKVTNLIF